MRVFSDPSEMIFSGPIVTSGPQPGIGSPVRSAGGQELGERVDVGTDADAQQLGAGGLPLGPGAQTPWSNSRSTSPATPFAAACCSVCR